LVKIDLTIGAIDKIAGLDMRHVRDRSGHGGDSFGQRLNI
jgi:hypothetical protein